jgi:hypothetical protein
MNAPAQILPPHLAHHVSAVHAMLPGCAGKELELRCRLLSARNSASFALGRACCSEDSTGVVTEIARLGTLYAFAPLGVDQLSRLMEALKRMMSAVGFLDDLAGSGDARG